MITNLRVDLRLKLYYEDYLDSESWPPVRNTTSTTTAAPPPELTTAVSTAMVTTARTLALPDLSSNVPLALEQVVAAALGSLPLWFLLGELGCCFYQRNSFYYCAHQGGCGPW